MAVALTAVNIWYQTHGLPEVARSAGSVERLLGAGAVVWFYLWKAIFPVHLIFNYPRWQIVPGDWRWWLPCWPRWLSLSSCGAVPGRCF